MVFVLWWNVGNLLAVTRSALAALGVTSRGAGVLVLSPSLQLARNKAPVRLRRTPVLLRVPTITEPTARLRCRSTGGNDEKEEEDDDDDDPPPQAYGNRSLSWSQKYRQLLPYEYARKTAMKLGLRSPDEWDDYLADGKVYHGPYLPNRPDEMYAEDWVSWEEFLGITRSYDEARNIVQQVLLLKSMDEYRAFVSADVKRAEGLRIPAEPEIVYRNKGWVSAEHFFNQL